MKVTIPSPLLSYTGVRDVTVDGRTVEQVLGALDARYPGIRFRLVDEQQRLRPHMRLFVGTQELHDLGTALPDDATLHIIQALSGG
jgi:molybdopterin converting factor small subunit